MTDGRTRITLLLRPVGTLSGRLVTLCEALLGVRVAAMKGAER